MKFFLGIDRAGQEIIVKNFPDFIKALCVIYVDEIFGSSSFLL